MDKFYYLRKIRELKKARHNWYKGTIGYQKYTLWINIYTLCYEIARYMEEGKK